MQERVRRASLSAWDAMALSHSRREVGILRTARLNVDDQGLPARVSLAQPRSKISTPGMQRMSELRRGQGRMGVGHRETSVI